MTNNLKAPKNDILSLCKLGNFIITNLDMSHMRQWNLSNAVTLGTELPWLLYTGGCITRVLINVHYRQAMNINELR